MEDHYSVHSKKKNFSPAIRSPIYIECRCREIEEIKINLSKAVETINELREENTRIKDQLEDEYKEKIKALEKECVYLKFLLKKESNSDLKSQLEKVKNLCSQKDKIIEIQEKKLKDIGKSIKGQMREIKKIVESKEGLERELNRVKHLDNPELLQYFYDFFDYSKGLNNTILYKTVKTRLGSSKKLSKYLQKHKCTKLIKNMLNLCKDLLNYLEFTHLKSCNHEDTLGKSYLKTSNSTNFNEKNSASEVHEQFFRNSLNSSPQKLNRVSDEMNSRSKRDSINLEQSYYSDSIKSSPIRLKYPNKVMSRQGSNFNEHSDEQNLYADHSPSNISFSLREKGEKQFSESESRSKDAVTEKNTKNSIPEEISIYPKDYSSLYQEGEKLLKLIDNQNSRLSKLREEITDKNEDEKSSDISEEISQGKTNSFEAETPSKVETFQRQRSRWDTNLSAGTNLRIPDSLEMNEKSVKKNTEKPSKKKQTPRNSPVPNRFTEYMRPKMKKEENWERVGDFFNSD